MGLASSLKLDLESKKFIKWLGRTGNDLQITAAESINESAEEMKKDYQGRLKKKQIVRTKFTLNAVKIFKATGVRRSGEPRALGRINAIIGVMKMKKGKKHYLAKLEEGVTQRGNSLTLGKVAVPLNRSRIGGKEKKSIQKINRLNQGDTQTLSIGGRKIGRKGDGYSARQRWGILYGQKRSGFARTQGDPKKPFYFIGNDGFQGIFKLFGQTFRKIRDLRKRTVRTKKRDNFKDTVKAMRPSRIQKTFIKKAKMRIGR